MFVVYYAFLINIFSFMKKKHPPIYADLFETDIGKYFSPIPESINYKTERTQDCIRENYIEALDQIEKTLKIIPRETIVTCSKLGATEKPLSPKVRYIFKKIQSYETLFKNIVENLVIHHHDELVMIQNYLSKKLQETELPPHLVKLSLIQEDIDSLYLHAVSKVKYKYNILNNYAEILIESTTYFNNIPNSSVRQAFDFLWSRRDPITDWYPQCQVSDNIIQIFKQKHYVFNTSSSAKFLETIYNNTQEFIKLIDYDKQKFAAVYLTMYRYAFDMHYTVFFKKPNKIVIEMPKPTYSPMGTISAEYFRRAKEYIAEIPFLTNPIDMGYSLSGVSRCIANIINSELVDSGKQPLNFIPADDSLELFQQLMISTEFVFWQELQPLFDEFAGHEDFPELFKYSCESMRVASMEISFHCKFQDI